MNKKNWAIFILIIILIIIMIIISKKKPTNQNENIGADNSATEMSLDQNGGVSGIEADLNSMDVSAGIDEEIKTIDQDINTL